MAAPTPQFTPEQVAQALTANQGFVFLTAKALGCSHDTIERMIKKHPECAAARSQQRGEMVDEAEGGLRKALRDREEWAIKFALNCLARERGYTEQHTVQVVLRKLAGELQTMSDADLTSILEDSGGAAAAPPGGEAPGPEAKAKKKRR